MPSLRAPVDGLPELRVHPPRVEPTLARRIRVVGLDVDGVLTDGGVYLGSAQSPAGVVVERVPERGE